MDVCFELWLPEMVLIDGLEQQSLTFTWSGVSYPQSGSHWRWGPYVELTRRPIRSHLKKLVPDCSFIGEDWISLAVNSSALDRWQAELNGRAIDWLGKNPNELVQTVLSRSRNWICVFELYCDQIDHVYEMRVNECMDRLRENLKPENKMEGFIAIGKMPIG